MLQHLIFYLVVLAYFGMAFCFFREWLDFFLEDEGMSSEQRIFSGIVLVIASILWVIIVPFAYLELLHFHKKHKKIIDFLIDISNLRINED
jgi:hypothetical protein